jgi:hypothetical protein
MTFPVSNYSLAPAGLAVEGIQDDTASITIIARAHLVEAACPACGKQLPPGPQPVCCRSRGRGLRSTALRMTARPLDTDSLSGRTDGPYVR